MKKIAVSLLAALILVLGIFALTSFASQTAVLKTTPFETTQNETFKTTVYLEENSNLIDFQVQFKYDTDLVSLVSVEECKDLTGTIEITEKSDGIIHISYTRTNENIADLTNLVNLEFLVNDNVGPDSYDFLREDESYDAEAHTMVGDFLEDLPLLVTFDTLKIYESGDINLDSKVSIADVTYLRQHLAEIRTLSDYQLKFADAYFDNMVSISDAVRIQQNLADEEIVLGNRVNITFYDKDGNVQVVKSVKYGSDLMNYPMPIEYRGFTWLGWSLAPNEYKEVNLTKLQGDMNVYAMYEQDASEAITFYKEKLTQTYYMNSVINSRMSLCSDITYQDGYNAKVNWASSNTLVLNPTTGSFTKPSYDTTVELTAYIVSYKDGYIEAEDSITFTYTAIGEYQCPAKNEIKSYLSTVLKTEIDTNMSLPRKITHEETGDTEKKYEVRINWAILGDDNTENGISQISRTAYEQDVTLVANVTFNGKPIEFDGKIYFDNIILKPISEKEVSDYIIDEISSNMGLSITNGEHLWDDPNNKYDANIRWISKNDRIAKIEANEITILSTAINGESLPLIAEVTYPTGDGSVTFELAYTISVVADGEVLVPGTNIDESLYDALKTATGVYGNLTTTALSDVKFVYLDLSGYPDIKDLSALTYCTNLRVLNISGLRVKNLTPIATLSKLEALIAKNCGLDDSSLGGGTPILKNMIYLKMLDLSYNNLTNLDSVFGEDMRYGRLQELYLGHNQLTDISAAKNAPLLQFLLLENNLLESDDLESFANFKVLKLLSLSDNNIDSISNLKNNRTLLELRLQGNNISDIRDLRYMTYLQSLYLGDNNISNVFSGSIEGNVSYLNYLTDLEILYLNNNNIEDIDGLTSLTKLKAVNVSNNKIQSLAMLSQSADTLEEVYAENNEIQSFGFIRNLANLKKLMLSGNSSVYDETVVSYLSALTKLETLTLSGKELGTLSFIESMPNLVRLDVADCKITSKDDARLIANLGPTLKYLDISNNSIEDISSLRQLSNLVVFYADNVNNQINASDLFALMSEIKYVSMENCGITDLGWLSKFRNLIYVNFAGNNLSSFDLGTYISERSTGTLEYLYIDSNTPFAFINSYTGFDDSVLKELSMENVQLDAVDYLPDMKHLEYLNISNSSVTDLRGSQPDMYGIFSIGRLENGEYRFESLKTVDVTGVQADISVLEELTNLEKVYAVGTSSEKAFYESNITALYNLYNRGVECYLYDYDTVYEPLAEHEGEKILSELPDISCNITVAADGIISDNNPILQDTINDFDITWHLSNEVNYTVADGKITVHDYANIADEELIVTAEISVYPDQAPVMRDFVVNTEILRADTPYLNIDSTGAGDFVARGAQFTYDVRIHAVETEGFSEPVAPVYDNIEYGYEVVLESGENTPTENVLITENAPQYQINPETEALESTVNITVVIGHSEASGYVEDKVITKSILIKTRTFELTYEANGGKVISNADGAAVTVRTYYEDAPLFEDITVFRNGYTFAGWYIDEGLSEAFDGDTMPQENITLWAKWNINTYDVTFESNEGSAVDAIRLEFGSLIPQPEEPEKEVHLFMGWYKDKALTQAWDFETDTVKGNTVLYAKWLLNEYTVTFNANGGSATTAEKFVYGSLLNPPEVTRDYYTFDGWYKDSACTDEWNLLSDVVTEDTTVYAKWIQNSVSGWVLASKIPVDAEVVERKYSYNHTYYQESYSTSLSGWTQYDSYWSDNGNYSFKWANFPGGYSTSDWIYNRYEKGQLYSYENATSKREATNNHEGYIYYHWCRGDIDYGPIDREIGYYESTTFDTFHAFTSDWSSTTFDSTGEACKYEGKSDYCKDTYWWFKIPYYTCSYKSYLKVYKYSKQVVEESTSYPSGSNISNIQEWVQYRNK